MGRRGTTCAVIAALWLQTAEAQRDPPQLDFLEYLGSWQGEDDEWLVISEWEKDDAGVGAEGSEDTAEPPRDRERDEHEGC